METESFIKVKTLSNPEYFIAVSNLNDVFILMLFSQMSILDGGLDDEEKELWEKNGTKTLKVLNNIRHVFWHIVNHFAIQYFVRIFS